MKRAGLHVHFRERIEFPFMAGRLSAPQFAHYLNPFREAGATLFRRNIDKLPFPGELATDTDTEDESTLGQVIQARCLFRSRRRVAHRQQINPRRNGQFPTIGTGVRQLHEWVKNR